MYILLQITTKIAVYLDQFINISTVSPKLFEIRAYIRTIHLQVIVEY